MLTSCSSLGLALIPFLTFLLFPSTQCLFPLVSRSLEDILASLVPVDHPVGSKRKNPFALGTADSIEPDHKRKRLNDDIAGALQDAPAVSDQQPCLSRADVENVNGHHSQPLHVELGSNAPGAQGAVWEKGPEPVPCSTEAVLTSELPGQRQPLPPDLLNTDSVASVLPPPSGALRGAEGGESSRSPHEALHVHSAVVGRQSLKDEPISPQHQAQLGQAPLSAHEHRDNVQPDPEDEASVEEMRSSDLLPLPGHPFWSNSENLCWLDSMLVALVNCKSLKTRRPAVEPPQSSVWRLLREFEDISCAMRGRQSAGGESGRVKH